MTITLNLTLDIEERLKEEAKRHGVSVDEFALELVKNQLPLKDRRTELAALLQSWIDEDDSGEQTDTGEYLVKVLDEDRLSDRKLFPAELKGVTW